MPHLSMDDVAALALAFPGVVETESYGHRAWAVPTGRPKPARFAWDRPFSKADVRRFGDDPVPQGEILAVALADLNETEAALAAHPGTVFTIPHLAGYPAVLVHLERATREVVAELLEDAYLALRPPAAAG
ncbi:hypothetical protein [Jatrophihabitans fulvus]